MRIKLSKKDLPPNFRVEFVELCPTCKSPMIFGESDTGFNTITSGDLCCYSFVQMIIGNLQKEGFLEGGATTLDILQGELSE